MKKCPMFSGTEECMYKDIGKWCADCPQLKGFLRRIYQSLTGGEEPDECGHRLFTQFLPPAFMKRHQDELTLVEEEARDEYERGRGDTVRGIKQEIEEMLSGNEVSQMLQTALTEDWKNEVDAQRAFSKHLEDPDGIFLQKAQIVPGIESTGLFNPNSVFVMKLEKALLDKISQIIKGIFERIVAEFLKKET